MRAVNRSTIFVFCIFCRFVIVFEEYCNLSISISWMFMNEIPNRQFCLSTKMILSHRKRLIKFRLEKPGRVIVKTLKGSRRDVRGQASVVHI